MRGASEFSCTEEIVPLALPQTCFYPSRAVTPPITGKRIPQGVKRV